MNLFYYPDIQGNSFILSNEESKHLIRVLRMKKGDRVQFTDGKGFIYNCTIGESNPKACRLIVQEKTEGTDRRSFNLNIAIAPTKNISRFEWFLEKATEIGIDRITPIICEHSERKEIKQERLNKVLVAAMKQSLKSNLPVIYPVVSFSEFIKAPVNGQKFIAYIDNEHTDELSKICQPQQDALVLIGPEGDFSQDEITLAKEKGFMPVGLGPSRLRTETAGVVACHTINMLNY